MDDRNGCRLFGSLRPSSYLERAILNTKFNPKERTRINACRHMLLVSYRNRQLGNAFPDVFLSLQWPGVFVLYGVRPLHSIGVPHQDRSTMYGLWTSLSRCNHLRYVAGSFLRRRTFPSLLSLPPRLQEKKMGASPWTTQESTNNKAQPRVESGS